MMLELFQRQEVRAIVPVMVGELQGDDRYANFFDTRAACELPSVRVDAVSKKLRFHLKRVDKGADMHRVARIGVPCRVKPIHRHRKRVRRARCRCIVQCLAD